MTTKAKPDAEKLLKEEREMGAEIERLEAELRELEAPSRPFTWEEIRAGAVEDLDKRERRKNVLPLMIQAAKARQLEIHRDRCEAQIGPLAERREKAEADLEDARAKREEATEREGVANGRYSEAHTALRYAEQELRQVERDLRALKGGPTGG
jgi:chromosome segregation ATPase